MVELRNEPGALIEGYDIWLNEDDIVSVYQEQKDDSGQLWYFIKIGSLHTGWARANNFEKVD